MCPQDERQVRVLTVKPYLQRLCGQTRFKQRLLLPDGGGMLSDLALLEGPADIHLVFLQFQASSPDQIDQLLLAAGDNNIPAM